MPTASASAAGVSSTLAELREPGRPEVLDRADRAGAVEQTSWASITRPTPQRDPRDREQHAADDRQVEGPARELRPAGAGRRRRGTSPRRRARRTRGRARRGRRSARTRVVGEVCGDGDLGRRLVVDVPGAASLLERVEQRQRRRAGDRTPTREPGRRRSRRPRWRRRRGARAVARLPFELLLRGLGQGHGGRDASRGAPARRSGRRAACAPGRRPSRGGSGSTSLRPATRERRSPANSTRSSNGAARPITALDAAAVGELSRCAMGHAARL